MRTFKKYFLALLLSFLLMPVSNAMAQGGEVRVLTIEGAINPHTARYLERGLREAERAKSVAVVVRLNTPGGLMTSMRKMSELMLASPVPIVVYVAPAGAHAASAGMFVTIAAHIAVMAPGTNIGAAHPVAGGGEEMDKTMSAKATNDAAALARSLAVARDRNAEWVEKAVRESVSITAQEALKLEVIDMVEADLGGVLNRLDGRTVVLPRGNTVLRTKGAPVRELPMNLIERILMALADPNIAYIFFSIGSVGLIAELYNPGSIFPGVIGAICLILAFVAFGSLPINWAGVLLLLIAMGLFAGELAAPGVGFFAIAGTVAFILGSLMLFTPITPELPGMPIVRVSPFIIAGTTIAIVGFFLGALRAVMRTRTNRVTTGVEALVGEAGVALSMLSPVKVGTVRVESEVWSALSENGEIGAGEPVLVTAVEGVTLRVSRQAQEDVVKVV